MSRTAVLLLTHLWAPGIEATFQALSNMRNSPEIDAWLLLDEITPGAKALAARYKRHHLFDEASVFNLPYAQMSGRKLIFHAHFPLLDFYRAHPEYDYYWVVEYDVRYTGEWVPSINGMGVFDTSSLNISARVFRGLSTIHCQIC